MTIEVIDNKVNVYDLFEFLNRRMQYHVDLQDESSQMSSHIDAFRHHICLTELKTVSDELRSTMQIETL